jgi:hypothetical protein
MKKRTTIIATLRKQLDREIEARQLELVGGGKITIVGGPQGTTAVNGDPDD